MNYERIKTSLGRIVRAERVKRGYSQEEFAGVAGLHRTYMGDVERGERNVSLYNLVRISEALDLPLSKLISDAEELASLGS